MPYSGTAYVCNMTTGCGQAMTGNDPAGRGRASAGRHDCGTRGRRKEIISAFFFDY